MDTYGNDVLAQVVKNATNPRRETVNLIDVAAAFLQAETHAVGVQRPRIGFLTDRDGGLWCDLGDGTVIFVCHKDGTPPIFNVGPVRFEKADNAFGPLT